MGKEREPGEPDLPTDTTTDIEPDTDNRHQQTSMVNTDMKRNSQGGDFSCKFTTCLPKTEKEKTQIWKTFWKWNSK